MIKNEIRNLIKTSALKNTTDVTRTLMGRGYSVVEIHKAMIELADVFGACEMALHHHDWPGSLAAADRVLMPAAYGKVFVGIARR